MFRAPCQRKLLTSFAVLMLSIFSGQVMGRFSLWAMLSYFIAIVSIFYVVYWAIKSYNEWYDSQYDLKKLFDVQEAPDETDITKSDYLYCLNCGAGYSSDLPVCPDCGCPNKRY